MAMSIKPLDVPEKTELPLISRKYIYIFEYFVDLLKSCNLA